MVFISMASGFALSLALKQRLEATRKWRDVAYWFLLGELDSESNISLWSHLFRNEN